MIDMSHDNNNTNLAVDQTDTHTQDLATFKLGMAPHLAKWLTALQQANDVLPKPLRFNELNVSLTNDEVGIDGSTTISLSLIEQLEALPVFAFSVVVQQQALSMESDNVGADSLNNTRVEQNALDTFAAHIKEWTTQNSNWQSIDVSKTLPFKDADLSAQQLNDRLTPVYVFQYILLPTDATSMHPTKKEAAAHILDEELTAHLRQFIDTLPITSTMGGAAAIDCHIVSLAKMLRPHRIACFDMDSTLIEQEVIVELANEAGIGEQVSAITESAMRGEIDFNTSFSERVALLEGLPTTVLDDIQSKLIISAGAKSLLRTLKSLGYYTVLVSGGFTYFAERIAKELGIDEVHANLLDIKEEMVTGEVSLPIVDGERKALLVEKIASQQGVTLAQVVCVGDGANDLPMMALADLGIAYHAKPIVRARADAAINATGLESVLYVLGYGTKDLL